MKNFDLLQSLASISPVCQISIKIYLNVRCAIDVHFRFGEHSEGRGTYGIENYFHSSEVWVLSKTVNSNPVSVDTGTGCAVREEQKHDFDQNQDSVPSYS